jgi:mono/diheme cytochrome c family protein
MNDFGRRVRMLLSPRTRVTCSADLQVGHRRAGLKASTSVMTIAACLCAGHAVHAQSPGVPPHAAGDGKALYETACISCHGPDGRGAPRSAVGFDLDLPDFTDCRFSTPERDADWLGIIQNGGTLRGFDRKMPAFGDALTVEEITHIIGYLRDFCRDAAWPRGNLNLPRPLVTEKAFPENEAVVTTTFDRSGPGAVSNVFVYEHRIGSRSQYEVVVPFDLQKGETGGWARGIGDIAVATKRALFHSMDHGSIVSGGAEVTFPTGKEDLGLGGGVTILESFVAYSQILPRDGFLHVHAGLEFPTNRDRASNEGYLRTAAGWTFTQNGGTGRAWSPMMELLAARPFEARAKTGWDIVPQMQVTLSKRGHIMASGGLQIPVNEREGRGKKLLVYLLWDWFDGGLFSGW